MNWPLEVFKKYAVFSGRARRREYWWFALFYLASLIVLTIIDVVFGMLNEQAGIGVLSGLFVLAAFVPSLSVSVRRLHDVGLSGWFVLIGLIPIIGAVVVLILVALRGHAGDNKYGPDPRASVA